VFPSWGGGCRLGWVLQKGLITITEPVIMQWFRLALSKGPIWLLLPTWGREQIQLPEGCFPALRITVDGQSSESYVVTLSSCMWHSGRRWQAVVRRVMNRRVYKMARNYFSILATVSCSRRNIFNGIRLILLFPCYIMSCNGVWL
jgi:hypothetical protein